MADGHSALLLASAIAHLRRAPDKDSLEQWIQRLGKANADELLDAYNEGLRRNK